MIFKNFTPLELKKALVKLDFGKKKSEVGLYIFVERSQQNIDQME
jgi:hypothetical protein